jgi:anti-sigma factor RsiW
VITGSGPFSSTFSEGDIHGLVDGRLDAGRQAEMTRRLKSHPVDRARVESWREQNELIKATFSEVESEPVPASLGLAPTPRLRCVSSEGQSIAPATASGVAATVGRVAEARRSRARLVALGIATGCVGLTLSWFTLGREPIGADLSSLPSLAQGDAMLAARTLDAIGRAPLLMAASAPGQPNRLLRELPMTAIPDLADSGFSFTGAITQPADPAALIYFYENAKADHLVLGIAKARRPDAAEGAPPAPAQAGRAVTWHAKGRAYALSGTLDIRRLTDIAASLQSAGQETSDRWN